MTIAGSSICKLGPLLYSFMRHTARAKIINQQGQFETASRLVASSQTSDEPLQQIQKPVLDY
jgi:hypothetical protein